MVVPITRLIRWPSLPLGETHCNLKNNVNKKTQTFSPNWQHFIITQRLHAAGCFELLLSFLFVFAEFCICSVSLCITPRKRCACFGKLVKVFVNAAHVFLSWCFVVKMQHVALNLWILNLWIWGVFAGIAACLHVSAIVVSTNKSPCLAKYEEE